MNTARIVVLMIALSASGVAAYLARGFDAKTLPAKPVVQLQTVDVLVAKSDIGLGRTVKPDDPQWQTWPAATASNTFISRNEKPEQAETLARARQSGTLSLRSIADVNIVELGLDDQALKRGESINVVRYGIPGATTTQK